jgi:hypothetical protein
MTNQPSFAETRKGKQEETKQFMRCKKMTDMTRRNFLKSAGVMTLAVAAAGVLSGCNSSKNPVMADVEVQYWYESYLLGKKKQVDDGSYKETVSVVKGGKVKKEQIEQTLRNIRINHSFDLKNKGLTEFDVDWTAEKPVAKIEMALA